MSVFDDYEYTSDHQSLFPADLCNAIVHHPYQGERFKFIEIVAVNRGVDIKVFADEARARARHAGASDHHA